MLKKGFVFPVGRNQMMSSHGLRASAIALDQDSSLRIRISTVRAIRLRLPPVQHMTCGMITLVITSFWRVPPTRWDFTALRRPPRKQYVLIMTRMPCTPIPRGVRRGAGTKGGPMTTRLKMKCHCFLLGRVLEMLSNFQMHDPWRIPRARNSVSLPTLDHPSGEQ